MTTTRLNRVLCNLISVSALFTLHTAQADTLQDFKQAESVKGCPSLPYSSFRDSCRNKQDSVNEWCKEEKRECQSLGIRGLLEAIEGMSGKVERLKAEKDALSSRKSSATDDGEKRELENKLSELENQIREISGRVDSHKRRVDENKTELRERLSRGERCRDYRREVQDVFKDAISRVKGESDSELRSIGQKLMEHWEESGRDHEREIDKVKQVIESCRERLDGKR